MIKKAYHKATATRTPRGWAGAPARWCAGLLLCAGLAAAAQAQQDGNTFRRYGPEQGLSHPSVLDIWQDRDGFMWFATEDGLNRFDGRTFKVYRHDPADSTSLSENWVMTLVGDPSGDFWVGTRNRGLNRFVRREQRFVRYPFGEAEGGDGFPSGQINTLVLSGNTLWAGIDRAGITRLDLAQERAVYYDPASEQYAGLGGGGVWQLLEDRDGYLWAALWNRGLSRFDPRTETFTHFSRREDDPLSLRSNRVRALLQDRRGYLWVGTSGGGLSRFDPRTETFHRYAHAADDPESLSHDVVWSLLEDSRGDLWVGTYGGGLNRFNPVTGTFTRFAHDPRDPDSFPASTVLSMFEDRSGLLWFGTDNGVVTYNSVTEKITRFAHDPSDPNGLSQSNVLAVVESRRHKNAFWVGTAKGGLNLLDLQAGRAMSVAPGGAGLPDLGTVTVSALAEDASGTVWMGTQGEGLFAYDPVRGTVRQYRHDPRDARTLSENAVSHLLVDRRGRVWVGTDSWGLNRHDPGGQGFTRYVSAAPGTPPAMVRREGTCVLHSAGINALLEDGQGRIWVGGEGGLDRLDPEAGTCDHFAQVPGDTTSLSHNWVFDLFEDETGGLWVGTYGGLNLFDPQAERFTRFGIHHGLASDVIYGMVGTRDGMLWMTTNRSLSRLDLRTRQILNYGIADGLPSTRFNRNALALSPHGQILLGGPDGINVLHPSVLRTRLYRPPLVITAFRKFGTVAEIDLEENQVLRLSHDESFFSFDFVLLDYANPEGHAFRYRMEGFDPEWQRAEGPIGTAYYRNRAGLTGSFVFQVQGIDSKGRVSERRLLVVIAPPWWKTPWFRASLLALSLALAASALLYGYRRKQQEATEKARMLAEGREQERHFLARELHDVPLQNLYSVRHRLEVIAREASLNGQAEVLSAAQGLLDQTTEDLRRICGELRPPALGPFGLSKAIRSHLRTFEEAHPELAVDFELAPDRQRLPEATRHVLFRIYQGAVSNVARHASARHVWVRFRLSDAEAVLEVEDDGCGFTVPKNWLELARQQHYGLLGIAEWVESIGGHFNVRSAPGEGATLEVRVPLADTRTWLPAPLHPLRRWFRPA